MGLDRSLPSSKPAIEFHSGKMPGPFIIPDNVGVWPDPLLILLPRRISIPSRLTPTWFARSGGGFLLLAGC